MDFTPRNVAKYAVKFTIQYKIAEFTKTTIADHTAFEEDDFVVRFGANVAAWGIADKLKPHTDKVIDKTADWLLVQQAKKLAKKETEEEK